MDQAKTLRDQAGPLSLAEGRRPKVIAVTSGKGGVGKTNVVVNLAVALSNLGQRLLVLDADIALGNIDVLFGIVPKYTLEHLLLGQKSLQEVISQGPCGVQILPAGSGSADLAHLTPEQKLILLTELDRLEQEIDIFLIDTAAGISSNVLYFSTVAQEIIVVASPEPTSLTDAYAVMKVLSKRHGEKRFKLLVNLARDENEGREVYRKLSLAAERFLDIAIDYIGFIPHDDYLRMAVSQQKSVVEIYPKAKSSVGFTGLAQKMIQWPASSAPKGNVQFLWRKILSQDSEMLGHAPLSEPGRA